MNIPLALLVLNHGLPSQKRRYSILLQEYVALRNEVEDTASAFNDGQLTTRRQSSLDPRRIHECGCTNE